MEWGIWAWVNEILSPHYPTTIWCFSGPACAPAVPPSSLTWNCKGVRIGGGELVWCDSSHSFIPKTAQGHLTDTEPTWGPNPGPWEGGGDDSSPKIQETPALCHKTCHTATPCGRWSCTQVALGPSVSSDRLWSTGFPLMKLGWRKLLKGWGMPQAHSLPTGVFAGHLWAQQNVRLASMALFQSGSIVSLTWSHEEWLSASGLSRSLS